LRNLFKVQGLTIALPGGGLILEAASLRLREGEVVTLLGPSGAGKSTIVRSLFAPDELMKLGYRVEWREREIATEPALIPQRGALLDHLDVAQNIALVQAAAKTRGDPTRWLLAVDLGAEVGAQGRSIATLSGGQAQRASIARVLAAGKKLIVMDEPSVGLDVVGVRLLARLIIEQARKAKVGFILITHDVILAAGASDRLLFLDPASATLVDVLPEWTGPAEFDSPEARQAKLMALEAALEDRLLAERRGRSHVAAKRLERASVLAPITAAGDALVRAFEPHLIVQSSVVFWRTMMQSFVRVAVFYAVVGALLGFVIPYVIINISRSLHPSAILELIKGTYIISLAPPLSGILFAATSGSSVGAWLGGLQLHGQVTALEGLGVRPARYLWAPSWVGLVVAYLATFGVFTIAMLLGGWCLYASSQVSDALGIIAADFIAPPPSRYPALARALWSVGIYTLAIASIVVAKGREAKQSSDDVTGAMTSSVMRVTLFVVVMELLSMLVMRAWGGLHG
jgi:ABC-type nitrate/sulfonate/bicarbonate transport system ATPase subunit/ABC-type transporter Mla maintaining outer membrane lipid asymmetry permease subunit MlaE